MVKAYRILIGNEKGGTGKSTLAMNLLVYMMKRGMRVASIDLDGRQGTLTNYIKNRMKFSEEHGVKLSIPLHVNISLGDIIDKEAAERDQKHFLKTLAELDKRADYIIIDTPGHQNHLIPIIHANADALLTPLNDSLVDIDVIAKVEADSFKVIGSSHYSQVVWSARQEKLNKRQPTLEWFVVKNRLTSISHRNQKLLDNMMKYLARRMGFTLIEGLKERMVYRELFLKGLTVLDLKGNEGDKLSMSHISARQEIRNLANVILKARK